MGRIWHLCISDELGSSLLSFAGLSRYEFITELQREWIGYIDLSIQAISEYITFSDIIHHLSAVFDTNLHLMDIDEMLKAPLNSRQSLNDEYELN